VELFQTPLLLANIMMYRYEGASKSFRTGRPGARTENDAVVSPFSESV